MFALIANYHSLPGLRLELLQRGPGQLKHVCIQGIGSARVKLEQQHSFPHIEQAGPVVRPELLPLRLELGDRYNSRVGGNAHIVAAGRIVVTDLTAVFPLVETLHAGRQHIHHPFRHRLALRFHARHRLVYAECIPTFERPQLVHEAPFHGLVYGEQILRNGGNQAGRVAKTKRAGCPEELCRAVLFRHDQPQAFSDILLIFMFAYGFEFGLRRWPIFHVFRIQPPELAVLGALIETLTCLSAQPTTLDDPLHHRPDPRALKHFAVFVPLERGVQMIAHVTHHVDSHQIQQPIGSRLRVSDHRAGQPIHFLYGVAIFQGVVQRVSINDAEIAVPNKVGCVLADDHPLAQTFGGELNHGFKHLGPSRLARDNFQQFQITWRIEKVRPQEMRLEIFTASFGDSVNRQAGGIGGNDTIRPSRSLDARQDLVFDIQPFHHGLDDPVRLGQAVYVIFNIPQGDQLRTSIAKQVGRPLGQATLPTFSHNAVPH